jgi:hypothetical protein
MKKLILTTILVGLIAAPVLANPTGPPDNLPDLSTWVGGNATHQYWTFSEGNVEESIPGTSWNASPEEQEPFLGNLVLGVSADTGTLSWSGDEEDGYFTGDNITVNLKIWNYPTDNAYKLIWVDVGFDSFLDEIEITGISASDHDVIDYGYAILPGEGCADFGIKIWPNPWWEEIEFTIPGQSGVMLDYIHIDTVCIPAPGAILLGSIGIGLVGWLRRRRTL